MFRRLFSYIAACAAITLAAQTQLEVPDFTAGSIAADTAEVEDADTYTRYTGNPAIDAFINAPQEVFPTIDHMTRMDMADYFNSGSPKPSKNSLNGDCRIDSASAAQVTLSTSDVSKTELSLLPMKSDTIIMVINTLKTPVPDSSVKFYTYPQWQPISRGLFMVPGLDDWTAKEAKVEREDLENAIPFMLARFTYLPETRQLILENNVGDYLPKEANKLVDGALKSRLVYRWDGSRMVKERAGEVRAGEAKQ